MCFLQTLFTTLWTIWTHRNLVIHEGKQPNPLDVILTSQSLLCRYKEAFGCLSSSSHCSLSKHRVDSKVGGPWQLIIKVAAARDKRHNRTGLAYEAKSIQGVVVVQGITSSTGKLISIAIQEAMIEAAVKARSLWFNQFLFLCGSKRAVNVTNGFWPPSWQERVLLTDWSSLAQNDVYFHSIYVPRIANSYVSNLAKLATTMPIHHRMINQDFQ